MARPSGDAVQDAQFFVQAHAAGNTFATRFRIRELDEVAGNIDHAVVFVHHDHAARAHDRAELCEALVIDGGIEHFMWNGSTGGTARLYGLDLPAGHASLADVVDEGLERRPQRHLNQAGVMHLADEGEYLRSGTLWAAGFREPRRALRDDGSDVVPGFNVVDVAWFAPQTLLRREGGRGRGRPASPSSEAINAVSSPQTKAPAPSTS